MQTRFSFLAPVRPREQRTRQTRNERIRDRTAGHCSYCGRYLACGESTRDHVIPKAKGGKTVYENLLLCCVQCNQRKGDLDLEDYRELYHGGDLFYYEILEGAA